MRGRYGNERESLDRGTRHAPSSRLEVPILDESRKDGGEDARWDGEDECVVQSFDIRMHDGGSEFFWQGEDDGDGLFDGFEEFGRETGRVSFEFFDKLVVEDGACDARFEDM